MELLRIKAFQPFACYRKPFSYGFWDTFPLPPFSTLSGMFHCGINGELDSYYPFKVAVVGIFENITYDMQTLIKFDRIRNEKKQILLEGFNKAFSSSPTYVANVTNIHLRIYFQAEKQLLSKLKENLLTNFFPYIGRQEDLARIDQLKIINPNLKTFSRNDRLCINYGIYLTTKTANDIGVKGSNFQLPFRYKEINGLRYFEKENVVYVDNIDDAINRGEYFVDEDLDDIFTEPVLIELFGDY